MNQSIPRKENEQLHVASDSNEQSAVVSTKRLKRRKMKEKKKIKFNGQKKKKKILTVSF